MGEAITPKDIGGRIKDLERRMEVMEQTSRNIRSSIRDGNLELQDSNGVGVVELGEQPLDGHHGIGIFTATGQQIFVATSEDGQVFPRYVISVHPAGSALVGGGATPMMRPGTNSPAYAELWRGDFYSVGSMVDYDISVSANGGNMDWRILIYQFGASPWVVAGIPGEVAGGERSGTITIPPESLLGGPADAAGRHMTLRVEARLNSGAFTADVAVISPFINHN